jgi:para-aminobenzoate synthetase component I
LSGSAPVNAAEDFRAQGRPAARKGGTIVDLRFPAAVTRRQTRPVPAAGDGFGRLAAAFGPDGDGFRLDSALADGRLGRWSFAGGEPLARLTGRRPADADGALDLELTIRREPDGSHAAVPRRLAWRGDPFVALRAVLAAYRPDDSPPPADADPPPFAGGLVGWFGYGVAWAIEGLPRRAAPPPDDAPDLLFLLVDDVLAHDHAAGTTTLTVTGRGPDGPAAAADLAAREAAWTRRLARGTAGVDTPGVGAATPAPAAPPAPAPLPETCDSPPDLAGVTAPWDAGAYRAAVTRCREHILAGDAFEICLTQPLSAPLPTTPWRLYALLRELNPAPFAAFLRAGGHFVAGASPERFLSVDRAGRLESRPIKGTRPRGATPEADAALRGELATAVKDGAENTMIVDLVRSDLGRVAQVGSVQVPEWRVVESYATVHQLVSTVTARLHPDRDALDAVRACFPPGSMTGAPKIEAMTIIEQLEPASRGVYAGALGWLGWDGALDLCVVIRTFVGRTDAAPDGDAAAGPAATPGHVTFGVGGAVTADSDPDAEYRESLDKARALLATLRRAATHDLSRGEAR